MIAPLPSRDLASNCGGDFDTSPFQTLIVTSDEDAAALRRSAFQLALASHDGHVRISRTEDFADLSSHAETVADERRTQCRMLANLTFRDGANIALPGHEARDARSAWVRATQALICGDLSLFHDQVVAAETLLEDALLEAAIGGDGDEQVKQLYLDMSLAVHQQRLRWSRLCRELVPNQSGS